MKRIWESIYLTLGEERSREIGVLLMVAPLVYDILMTGVLRFNHISICWKGIVIQLIGFSIYKYSQKIDRDTQ